MGIHFEMSDFSPEVQKKIMRQLAQEDKRKQKFPEDIPGEESPKKQSKYKAEKIRAILYDGTEYVFDSKKEYKRYCDLEILQLAGDISELRLQVPYILIPAQKLSTGKTERKCEYVADFVYTKGGMTVVEDVKGYRKGQAYALFKIKKKLMKYIHDIEVVEI